MDLTEIFTLKDTGSKKICFVRDTATGRVFCRKSLSVYDVPVFDYLSSSGCPNLPEIIGYTETDGRLTVLEEYVPGENLAYVLQNGGLSRAERFAVIRDICSALRHLHSAKPYPIIHRDIKPQNVMLTEDGRAVLIDLETAVMYRPGETRDRQTVGTREYAAPEQYGYSQSDERTDIYALGKIIGELFPRDARMLKVSAGACETDPENRFQDIDSLENAVARARAPLFRRRKIKRQSPGPYEYFCTNCGAVLNTQPGFKYNDGTWVCKKCGQTLYGDGIGDTGDNLSGVIWYCDGCGAIMNGQPGFDYYADEWTCAECGLINDISENNIDPEKPRK